jgi:hypothetical protein
MKTKLRPGMLMRSTQNPKKFALLLHPFSDGYKPYFSTLDLSGGQFWEDNLNGTRQNDGNFLTQRGLAKYWKRIA